MRKNYRYTNAYIQAAFETIWEFRKTCKEIVRSENMDFISMYRMGGEL